MLWFGMTRSNNLYIYNSNSNLSNLTIAPDYRLMWPKFYPHRASVRCRLFYAPFYFVPSSIVRVFECDTSTDRCCKTNSVHRTIQRQRIFHSGKSWPLWSVSFVRQPHSITRPFCRVYSTTEAYRRDCHSENIDRRADEMLWPLQSQCAESSIDIPCGKCATSERFCPLN